MQRRVLAIGAVLALVLGVIAGIAGLTLSARQTAVPTVSSIEIDTGSYAPLLEKCFDPATTQPQRVSECVLNLVHQATEVNDFGAAMAVLRDSTNRTYDMVGRCHNATHDVGWAMVEAGMPLEDVYQVPFPDCRFGMYHGALSKSIETLDIEALKAEMPTLCEPFGDPSGNAHQECVHVLGHFVVDRIGTDLPASLAACGVFTDSSSQSRCVDGVFMQAIDLSRPGVDDPTSEAGQRIAKTWGVSRDEQEKSATDTCLTADSGDVRYVCYTAVSQTLAVLWRGDFTAVGQACAKVPEEGRRACFEGVAAAAFTLKDWDPKEIAGACHAVENEGTRYCMGSMAFTFGLQDTSDRAGDVCALAKPHEESTCREQLKRGRSVYEELRATTGDPVTKPSGDASL